jgi:putative transposase
LLSRETLGLIADTSTSGARVAPELNAPVWIYGQPACIVSENRTASTTRAILKQANDCVAWHYDNPTTFEGGLVKR